MERITITQSQMRQTEARNGENHNNTEMRQTDEMRESQ